MEFIYDTGIIEMCVEFQLGQFNGISRDMCDWKYSVTQAQDTIVVSFVEFGSEF